ncbi:pumilio likey domain family member 6 [Acrodontium crateriforme]|uniref:Pumilio likey domain family member 6 n=1 Tax=Acrodontium crateriforme TaxID=150365 RepID=A0AAQ3RB55_9PEZI|nr:pumilio likey domain family member 6 [Acrodontium crateriforme]
MSGVKRKEAPLKASKDVKKQKVTEHKSSRLEKAAAADEDDFDSFSGENNGGVAVTNDQANGKGNANGEDPKKFKLETSSAEAHAKQRALAKERKAAKPNADVIQRSKKIWERLRRKSHVPKEERKQLVEELFTIINGRVRDFVFKHDSVRVIQCALKYANQEQRRMIVDELQADIRPLVESRYGKFLVAKMVVEGDQAIRDIIIPQFYGHVKRLANHPEASWIVDDIYRQVASTQQKACMLREWYGPEFALFQKKPDAKTAAPDAGADLAKILQESPEKRKPILQHLFQLINSLVQKKMTGFTMLHDAMLQYFLVLTPGSEEHNEVLELLKSDIDKEAENGGGDMLRNLAFTKSGSRLVCLAIAYGSAKDRKIILKCYKDTVELMAYDQYAKLVLIAGLDVPDDTKMSGRAILHEVLGQNIEDVEQRLDRMEQIIASTNARLPVLYPLAGMAKWLVNDQDMASLAEIHEIRNTTSKKAPEVRRKDLLEYLSAPLLELVSQRASNLVQSSFGCQCISETLLETQSDAKADAKKAVADLAAGDPTEDGHVAKNSAAGRMLKTLVLGGSFDPATKTTKLAEPRLGFAEVLYPIIKDHLVQWACSDSSFVVVALLESEDMDQKLRKDVKAVLAKGKKKIEAAAKPDAAKKTKGNAGARILLEKMA